jgi:lysophospholipase L1-like esterase
MSDRPAFTETSPARELERLVRYCHPAKILGTTRLPGLDALDEPALARLCGVSLQRYRDVADAMRREAADAARSICVRPAGLVLAFGDSHTDDLGSWAEILGVLVPVINAGLSGDTTTAALARVHRLPPAAHAVVMLGTNDARRHGDLGTLVSHRETLRNLRAIDRVLRVRCRHVTWITPPPVDEDRVRRDPGLVEAGVTWRSADVAAKAALVRNEWPDAIDLWPEFEPRHLAGDGLHPSAAGQRLIAGLVARRLGAV